MIKSTIAATACAIIAAAVVARPQDDEREIQFNPPVLSVIEKPNTIIVRRGSESLVMTKIAYRRDLNGVWPDMTPEQLSAVLVHCEKPIANYAFALRDFHRAKAGRKTT